MMAANSERCRACLENIGSTDKFHFFNYEDPKTNMPIHTKIKSFLDVTGEEFDKLKMCLTCVDLLDSAYLFQSICTKTEQQLVKEATQVETIQIKQEKPDEFMQLDDIVSTETIDDPFAAGAAPKDDAEGGKDDKLEVMGSIVPCLKLSTDQVQKEHPNIQLTCQKCNIQFKDADEMIKHKDTNCSKKNIKYKPTARTGFQCVLCERYFGNQRTLSKHLNDYPNCEDELQDIRDINESLPQLTNVVDVKDEVMEQEAPEDTALEQSPFTCTECKVQFMSEHMLNLHNKLQHTLSFTCKVCDETFDSKELLTLHFRQIHVYDCTECDLKFIVEEQLERHYEDEHPDEEEEGDAEMQEEGGDEANEEEADDPEPADDDSDAEL